MTKALEKAIQRNIKWESDWLAKPINRNANDRAEQQIANFNYSPGLLPAIKSIQCLLETAMAHGIKASQRLLADDLTDASKYLAHSMDHYYWSQTLNLAICVSPKHGHESRADAFLSDCHITGPMYCYYKMAGCNHRMHELELRLKNAGIPRTRWREATFRNNALFSLVAYWVGIAVCEEVSEPYRLPDKRGLDAEQIDLIVSHHFRYMGDKGDTSSDFSDPPFALMPFDLFAIDAEAGVDWRTKDYNTPLVHRNYQQITFPFVDPAVSPRAFELFKSDIGLD